MVRHAFLVAIAVLAGASIALSSQVLPWSPPAFLAGSDLTEADAEKVIPRLAEIRRVRELEEKVAEHDEAIRGFAGATVDAVHTLRSDLDDLGIALDDLETTLFGYGGGYRADVIGDIEAEIGDIERDIGLVRSEVDGIRNCVNRLVLNLDFASSFLSRCP